MTVTLPPNPGDEAALAWARFDTARLQMMVGFVRWLEVARPEPAEILREMLLTVERLRLLYDVGRP